MKKENIKNIRKSIISMMVIMVMVITMVGCNKETTENTPNETISSEITETTTEVVSEEVENTKVEISRESIPCECCNGEVQYFIASNCVESDNEIPEEYKYTTTTYPDIFSELPEEETIYAKITEDIDFYNYSQECDFIYLYGYITKDTNVKINKITGNKDWVYVSTNGGRYVVRYEDIMTNNLYVEVDEFKFSYEEEQIEVAENDTSDSETTTENTSSNVQPEQPSNNEPTTVQPTTEEQVTPPPSTPTTEEVVVEPTPEPQPEPTPTPTVTADQIVAEFNATFTAYGMTPAPDGPSGLGYGGIRCKTGNYKEQANAAAWTCSSMGYKYFYITISDNGDGSFMVTYYYG